MPKRYRINLTMSRNLYETFSRMSELTGDSRSALIVEILETINPPLQRTIALLEAASQAPLQVRQGLRTSLEAMEQELAAAAGVAQTNQDLLLASLGRTPPSGGERASEQSDPRTSNTGVTSFRTRKNGK